jgi:hypothetical protein
MQSEFILRVVVIAAGAFTVAAVSAVILSH